LFLGKFKLFVGVIKLKGVDCELKIFGVINSTDPGDIEVIGGVGDILRIGRLGMGTERAIGWDDKTMGVSEETILSSPHVRFSCGSEEITLEGDEEKGDILPVRVGISLALAIVMSSDKTGSIERVESD
jgi:hypothetical protein